MLAALLAAVFWVSGAPTEIRATAVSPTQLKTQAAPTSKRLAAPQYRKVVLMPLSSLGSTNEAVQATERILVGELKKILGPKLLLSTDLAANGRHVKAGLDACEGLVECLTEVVGALGLDAFAVGNVAGLGERRVINLKLVDARTGGEVRRISEQASGEEKELIGQMRKAAVGLVAPELFVGALEITAKQPKVRVMIDGQLALIKTGQPTRFEVAVGRHAIEASGDGLVPFSAMVDLAYGESKQVTIDLPRSTAFLGGSTPFRYRWWTWAIMGAGLVAGGLGAYFNYLHVDGVDRINKRAKSGQWTSDSVELNTEQKANWQRATVFYGVGGGLVGISGVLLSFDLF